MKNEKTETDEQPEKVVKEKYFYIDTVWAVHQLFKIKTKNEKEAEKKVREKEWDASEEPVIPGDFEELLEIRETQPEYPNKQEASSEEEEEVPFVEGSLENLYKWLSFIGAYDIHDLKKRDPELYAKIMNKEASSEEEEEEEHFEQAIRAAQESDELLRKVEKLEAKAKEYQYLEEKIVNLDYLQSEKIKLTQENGKLLKRFEKAQKRINRISTRLHNIRQDLKASRKKNIVNTVERLRASSEEEEEESRGLYGFMEGKGIPERYNMDATEEDEKKVRK